MSNDPKFSPMMSNLGPTEQRIEDIASGKVKVDVKASLREVARKIDAMRTPSEGQAARDEAMRIANHRMRSVLDELIMNADGVVAGRLAHFSKKEFAQTVADRARWALLPNSVAPGDASTKEEK